MSEPFSVGCLTPRREAMATTCGRERYVSEVVEEGMVWAVVRRAGVPSAPGVLAVLTASEVKGTDLLDIMACAICVSCPFPEAMEGVVEALGEILLQERARESPPRNRPDLPEETELLCEAGKAFAVGGASRDRLGGLYPGASCFDRWIPGRQGRRSLSFATSQGSLSSLLPLQDRSVRDLSAGPFEEIYIEQSRKEV